MTDKPPLVRAPTSSKPFPVRVVMVLMLDGAPGGTLAVDVEMTPDPGGVQLNWVIDARQVAQVCEQVLEPSSTKSKLWTPDRQGAPVVLAKPKD